MIEIDFSELPSDHPSIISYDAKWNPLVESFHRVHSVCPAKLSKRLEKKVKTVAHEAYKITGCKDYARLDIRIRKDNRVFVLEVNPNPDLTEGAGFMRSAAAAGLSYAQALKKIALFAWDRRPNSKN